MKKKIIQLAAIMLHVAVVMALVTTCSKDDSPQPALSVSPAVPSLVFSPSGKVATFEGNEIDLDFKVTTNQGTWDALSSAESWLTVTKTATGFTLSVKPNEIEEARTAKVTVLAEDAKPRTINVTQLEGGWEDVTADYLLNTKPPFEYGDAYVSRFHLLWDWTVNEEGIGNGNVDTWAGFPPNIGNVIGFITYISWPVESIVNGKMYQTVELDAGTYRFDVEIYGSAFGSDNCYIVAALGDMPDTEDLLSQALNYIQITPGISPWNTMYEPGDKPIDSIEFEISEKSTVSLGFLVNMSGSMEIKFGVIKLWKKLQ